MALRTMFSIAILKRPSVARSENGPNTCTVVFGVGIGAFRHRGAVLLMRQLRTFSLR